MRRLPNSSVSSSVGIKIRAPDIFSVSGETEFSPGVRFGEGGTINASDVELLLGDLYSYLNILKQQEQKVLEIIERVKARSGL